MGLDEQFRLDFQALGADGTKQGPPPLRWQTRLFFRFCDNEIPRVCDLPTGMGKTSVIHLWILALIHQTSLGKPRLPTRLVYVVDRRTVVDQATTVATRIRGNLPKDLLTVSTLRGRFADNRDWAKDPSRPAIIVGTVDMIGSRLLFSGYRSSYKWRPLDAGMLGQDSFLVLDEAHLSTPFESLVTELGEQGKFQGNQGSPMRVMRMSATAAKGEADTFTLVQSDLEGDPEENPIVQRYGAKKRLVQNAPVDKDKILGCMVNSAVSLAKDNARVVVFVQRPDDAGKIATGICNGLKLPKGGVPVLTGTMRGLERDEFLGLDKLVLQRFLDGEERPEHRPLKAPAVLVSTSAGEVGFDLNADHMVCDAAPLDSMIQRLGRVNRRGYGDAEVQVFVRKRDTNAKKAKPQSGNRPTWESASTAAVKCMGKLAKNVDGTFDASPRSIEELVKKLTEENLLEVALAPKPEIAKLTDILLDAWSLTTVTERMPGRPPVGPWLRGLSDEEPQTSVAWRAELDLPGFGELSSGELDDWFDAHRVLTHEVLAVPPGTAQKWVRERWNALPEKVRDALGDKPCIIDRSGLQVLSVKVLVDGLEKRADSIRGADLILPASFGGISRGEGVLDKGAPDSLESETDPRAVSDVADIAEGYVRHRFLRTVGDGNENEKALVGVIPHDTNKCAVFMLEIPSGGYSRRQLVSLVPKRERPDYGTDRQTLRVHVGLVEKCAIDLAKRLRLTGDVREAFRLAAEWHDHGKDRECWQFAVGRKSGEDPLGKSGGRMRRIKGGYRHEFGSLHEFREAHEGTLAKAVFDLAMHLISAHHGRGRPYFPTGDFDPYAPNRSHRIAVEAIERFARLQRQYGHWQLAWLENLLRCADAMASSDKQDRT